MGSKSLFLAFRNGVVKGYNIINLVPTSFPLKFPSHLLREKLWRRGCNIIWQAFVEECHSDHITLSGGRRDCVTAVCPSPLCAWLRFFSSHSSSLASSALMTSSSSSWGFLKRRAKKIATMTTFSGWLTKMSWNIDTNMDTSHSSCCLFSNWSPYNNVKNPAATAVEMQKNHPKYTNHHGNKHFVFFLLFFSLVFSGETKGEVDPTESRL